MHQSDVDAAGGIAGAGAQLDASLVPVGPGQPKDQLLDAEVAGIGGLLLGVASEIDHQRHLECEHGRRGAQSPGRGSGRPTPGTQNRAETYALSPRSASHSS